MKECEYSNWNEGAFDPRSMGINTTRCPLGRATIGKENYCLLCLDPIPAANPTARALPACSAIPDPSPDPVVGTKTVLLPYAAMRWTSMRRISISRANWSITSASARALMRIASASAFAASLVASACASAAICVAFAAALAAVTTWYASASA